MAKPRLDTASIPAALRLRMGNVSHLERIAEGEESLAFRFSERDRDLILRVRYEPDGFRKDDLAYKCFARPSLPIPQIVDLWPVKDLWFCVSEAAPGITLQDLPVVELPNVLAATARVLDAIAHSDTERLQGWGPFDHTGVGKYATWQDFLASICTTLMSQAAILGRRIKRGDFEAILDRFADLVHKCPEKRGLIHGDFGSNNVLTDGRSITAVIDWSEAAIGDPLYDVANIFFWRTWLPCMEAQAAYFDVNLASRPEMRTRLLCYQLRIGLAEIYANAVAERWDMVDWAMKRCLSLIR